MSGLSRFVGADALDTPLRRFRSPRPAGTPGKTCELCAATLDDPIRPDDRHRHVVDLDRQGLLCTCRGCALLFTEHGAAGGRYRVVPERVARLEPFTLEAQQWAALQVPVGIAFFLRRSEPQRTVGFYPSPAGATESELPLDAWDEIVGANPALRAVEADTEAALVRLRRDAPAACFIVPIDRCYELVGRLRRHWRGFDGGQEARERIAAFFDELAARSRPLGGGRARQAGGSAPA